MSYTPLSTITSATVSKNQSQQAVLLIAVIKNHCFIRPYIHVRNHSIGNSNATLWQVDCGGSLEFRGILMRFYKAGGF